MIVCVCVFSLYGTAMCESLPERSFEFMPEHEATTFDYTSVPDDGPTGYILEVDLEYPKHLHDSHSDYPLCPESTAVNVNELSPYSRSLADKLGIQPTGKCRKLIANLKDKKRYVLHYRNLKLYTRLGMVVTKIHRVLSFTQSKFLKAYIDFNTSQRKKATTDFAKDFFKLMNNSVFGKVGYAPHACVYNCNNMLCRCYMSVCVCVCVCGQTMENVRKHVDLRLVTTEKRLRKLTSQPNFRSFKIFSEQLVGVSMSKKEVRLDKPTYVGMSILDLSKLYMYQFHYDKIMTKYGPERVKLLMTDTDSLVYHVITDDYYKDMIDDLDAYDTSDFPTDHPAHSRKHCKALGKMKDEYASRPIQQFVGLRSKLYSILEADGKNHNKAKGISKRTTARMMHECYTTALFDEKTSVSTMQQIRSKNHQVFTMTINKVGLSPYDDKRYVLDDKVSTLAHGHYRIARARGPPSSPQGPGEI